MKITVLTNHFRPRGGLEKYTKRSSEELEKLGHEIHVIAPKEDGMYETSVEVHPIPLKCLKLSKHEYLYLLGNTVKRVVEELKPDCVLVQGKWHSFYFDAVRYDMPRSVIDHTHYPTTAYLRLVKKLFSKVLDYPMKFYHSIGRVYKTSGDEWVPGGVDEISYSRDPPLNEDYILLFGRPVQQKGFHLFLERVVPKLSEDVKIVLAGRGDFRWLKKYVPGGRENVIFLGEVSDPYTWMHHARVVAFPSVAEGTPLSLLEAMKVESLIVARKLKTLEEILEDSGFLAEDETEMAEIINQVLKERINDERQRRLRKKAGELASKYTWKNTAKRIEKLCLKAVAKYCDENGLL